MQVLKFGISFLFVLGLLSCKTKKAITKSETPTAAISQKDKDCPDDLMCTMDYRMITVSVYPQNYEQGGNVDSSNAFLADDPSVSLRTATSEDMKSSSGYGVFIVAEDGNMHLVKKSGSKVIFVAYKNGVEKVRSTFVIGHDCCHIQLISGPKELNY